MTIDCSTLKPGNVCLTRGGGEAVFIGINPTKLDDSDCYVFACYDDVWNYYKNGRFKLALDDSYDIISIKPEKKVLKGWMGFKPNNSWIWYKDKPAIIDIEFNNIIAIKPIEIEYTPGEGLE